MVDVLDKKDFLCGVCGGCDFEVDGLQWWPTQTVERYGWAVAATDPARPNEVAVRLLICTRCGNSYIAVRSPA